jgi:hypothetical protein
MTFDAFAYTNTEPSWIYGGGDLWLYDWVDHFDLLRISATTGVVLRRLVVPRVQTPILAFNDEGLWIAPTGESTGPLYHLAAGARDVASVFEFGQGGFAWWLLASGDFVWLDAQQRPVSKAPTVWELRGPDAKPIWHVAGNTVTNLHLGTLATDMVGDGADGLWTALVAQSQTEQEIVRMSPRTGGVTVVATLAPAYERGSTFGPSSALQYWKAATLNGSLFLLDPPAGDAARRGEVGEFSALYRIGAGGS